MIVATAGHVDHGKTTLVKALTGVDARRLPEEKRRGMTIDLGFVYSGALGFVDVPGHERFVHNMLAGVSGIDLALLVVAADDGIMPQTREHLAIVRLLGVPQIAIALTKTDRVPPARTAEVAAQLGALVPGAPLFALSSASGEGIGALKRFLDAKAARGAQRACKGNFRMSVDRAFSLAGAGLVVTGTVMSGEVAVGAEVRALLAGAAARIRGLHAHGAPAGRAHAGQRVALNLAGLDARVPVRRGDWIVCGAVAPAVARFDARWVAAAGTVRDGTPVHLHLGAADVLGRIAHLGGNGFVRLHLEQAVGAACGDRFIVRDVSARRTLGGGTVLDVFPPARRRARPERLAWLAAMALEDDEAALKALLDCAPAGVDMARFAANRNLPAACGWRFSDSRWRALKAAALAEMAALHARSPHESALPAGLALKKLHLVEEVASRLVEELVSEGAIVREPRGVRLAAHRAGMSAGDAALWKRVAPLIERAGLRPPTLAELAAATGMDAKGIETALARLVAHGLLVRVSKTRFFTPAGLQQPKAVLLEMKQVSAAAFRDRLGVGRGLAIELLEYFDRVQLTRRVGDSHVLRRDSRAPA